MASVGIKSRRITRDQLFRILGSDPELIRLIESLQQDVSAQDLAVSGTISSSSPSAGIGYATGAGGAVAQATSKSTGVTLNAICGDITMNAAALAAGAKVSFTVTNSSVGATDMVMVAIASGGTANAYRAAVTAIAAGSFNVTVENITAGSLSEAPVVRFTVFNAVNS